MDAGKLNRLLLRPAEAAEVLGIGRSKTYELIASGVIPSIRIDTAVRVPADALRQWVADQLTARDLSKPFESRPVQSH